MLFLKDILHQDQPIERIRQAFSADRLPHGLIFAGPHGVGKAAAAQALAAWFLCDQPGQSDACGKCRSCHLVSSGTHPDFHLVYRQLIRLDPAKKDHKARDLSIHVIRPYLLEPASLKSAQGRGKVFVVLEAETMSRDATNALLKTLEEPQGRCLIILLTDQANSLLPTIRSRCQLVQFQALPADFIIQKLCQAGIDQQSAELAAIIADGSLGNALQWSLDGLAQNVRPLYGMLSAILSGKPTEGFAQLTTQIAAAHVEKEQDRDPDLSKDQANRETTVLLLRLAADFLRNQLMKAPAPAQLRICRWVDDIAQAQQYIEGNVNVNLVLENLANRLR